MELKLGDVFYGYAKDVPTTMHVVDRVNKFCVKTKCGRPFMKDISPQGFVRTWHAVDKDTPIYRLSTKERTAVYQTDKIKSMIGDSDLKALTKETLISIVEVMTTDIRGE